MPKIILESLKTILSVPGGTNLREVLCSEGIFVDAPCGGKGRCGKCTVWVNGVPVLACQTIIREDSYVSLGKAPCLQPAAGKDPLLKAGKIGYALAIDIGTTSVVCCLIDGKTGKTLETESMLNPQSAYGADVISRICEAIGGRMRELQDAIQNGLIELIQRICERADIPPAQIEVVSLVGNCCMQQIFLGILPTNLAQIPYAPVLTRAETVPAAPYLPICSNARLLIVPDIGGFVGADTVGCVLSTRINQSEEIVLLVDIGTNGEMVLGSRHGMIACSAAAGPALEGANILFGMRGTTGAIDHVWMEEGQLKYSTINGGAAKGICGSGLIDAVAAGLETGLLNKRGRIGNEQHIFYLTDTIYLSQDDIRQVQLAKGAIHAGILLMARKLRIQVEKIDRILLAGAFGSHIDPVSACRIGLLPKGCENKIEVIGNAAESGAKLLACDMDMLQLAQNIAEEIEFLELASFPGFSRTFAESMNFQEAPR